VYTYKNSSTRQINIRTLIFEVKKPRRRKKKGGRGGEKMAEAVK